MPAGRTIAVLPFEDLSDDAAGGAAFARGFAEDLITELARFPQLELIHAHSSFSEDLARLSDRELGAELGARYVLRGTVRRARGRGIVTIRLSDARTGRQVAAERFEAEARELPALESDVAATVAASLAIRIDDAHLARARRKPVEDLEAYECWLRGIDLLRRGTNEHDATARSLFRRAIELDPCFARAHAGLSLSHFNDWSCQAWEDWDETERLAFESARRAAHLDDSDHVTQIVLARIHLYRREFDAALRRFELALRLNASDADGLVQIAFGLGQLGEPARAVELVEKAKRLNPKHEDWYFAFEAYVRYAAGHYDEVLRLAEIAAGMLVDLPAVAAVAARELGDPERAARSIAEFVAEFEDKILFGRTAEPGEPLRWLLHVNPLRRPEDEERFTRRLLAAGLAPDPDREKRAGALRADPAGGSIEGVAAFVRDGDTWELVYRGEAVRLAEVKGFHDLAALLSDPGREVHCLELAGRPAAGDRADPVLDAEARRGLELRARELQQELDEARSRDDLGRIDAVRAEMAPIVEELSRALGLGGRSRALGSEAEKARTAVTWRIRSAIRKIAAAHPALGKHLANSVRTGGFCAYEPEVDVEWRL